MITERKFASSFTSFWREVLPLGDRFARLINLQSERFLPPLQSTVDPGRRGIINEAGFLLFHRRSSVNVVNDRPSDLDVIEVLAEATAYVHRIDNTVPEELGPPTATETAEVVSLAVRLDSFFTEYFPGTKLVFHPMFAGCGKVDTCEGDVLAGKTLCEVKAGERDFRLTDLRQVLVYCALNHVARQHQIERLTFVNPRRGTFVMTDVETVCRMVAGTTPQTLLSEIIEYLSQPVTSG